MRGLYNKFRVYISDVVGLSGRKIIYFSDVVGLSVKSRHHFFIARGSSYVVGI